MNVIYNFSTSIDNEFSFHLCQEKTLQRFPVIHLTLITVILFSFYAVVNEIYHWDKRFSFFL